MIRSRERRSQLLPLSLLPVDGARGNTVERTATALLILLAVAAAIWVAVRSDGEPADVGEPSATAASQYGPATLTLYCGAGIRPAAEALSQAFEAKHNVIVRATYAGSGVLLGQITANEKGDLFMPGAESYVDRAIELELAHSPSKRVVAYFIPVIFVQKGNPKGIHGLEDFTRAGLRLGLGDERSCAIGRKTLKIFKKNDMPLSDIEPNVRFKSATVNELGVQIQLDNVDAVIVWDVIARHFIEDGTIVPIPIEQNLLSTIPIVRLLGSTHPDAADGFIRFVTSDEGRRILRDKKYTVDLSESELTSASGSQ